MLQTTIVGKKTSERGAAVVSMVVTTVLLLKSVTAAIMKNKATPKEATIINTHINCSLEAS